MKPTVYLLCTVVRQQEEALPDEIGLFSSPETANEYFKLEVEPVMNKMGWFFKKETNDYRHKYKPYPTTKEIEKVELDSPPEPNSWAKCWGYIVSLGQDKMIKK